MASSRSLGSLTLDLIAKIGGFEQGFDKAARIADARSRQIQRTVSTLSAGIVGAFAGINIASSIGQAIELGDEMGKLAEKTGLTASAASELSNVFKQNDLDNQALSTSFQKMQVALSKNSDIFKQLGLDSDALKAKKPDEAFELIAQRISEIADPADRARAAVEIFGKSGASLLPLMNQGAEGIRNLRKELGGLSDDDVEKLQQADDAIKKLGFLKQDFWNNVAVGIVTVSEAMGFLDKPARVKASEDLNKLLNQRISILENIRKIENNGSGQTKTAQDKALEVQRNNLKLVQSRIDAVNESLLVLDRASNKAATGQGELDESLSETVSGLSEVTVSVEQAKSAYQELIATQIEAYEAEISYHKEVQKQRNESNEALQDMFNNGVSGLDIPEIQIPERETQTDNYDDLMERLGIYVEDVKLSYEEMYAVIDDQRQRDLISEQQAVDARIALSRMERDDRLGAIEELTSGLTSLMSSGSRRAFEIGKAAAIANATVSAGQAIMNAYATQPWYVGLAQGVSAAAMLYSQIENIKNTQFQGYQQGGYTGNGGISDVAGVVHGREYVMDAASTARLGVGNLDALRQGNMSFSGDVSVHNYGGSKVEAERLSSGEVQIMIDRSITKQTPKLVSGQLSSPNSQVSKSMSRNYKAPRNR